MPRLILAALVGGALSVSGYILQAISRNPLADAGLLGINSGAAFGSVLYYFIIGSYVVDMTGKQSISLVLFGLVGALTALLFNFILTFNRSSVSMSRLILNGIGISTLFSAVTTYFSLKINADDYARVNNWLEGAISQGNWQSVRQLVPWVLSAILIVTMLQKQLEVLRYSDHQLQNIGVSIDQWRFIFIALAALLVCSSVIVSGNVVFVGLIVPHLTLKLMNRQSYWFIPMVFINGMSLVVICDTFVKTAFSPTELPLNAMMGVLGIPYLLSLFMNQSAKLKRSY